MGETAVSGMSQGGLQTRAGHWDEQRWLWEHPAAWERSAELSEC